MDTPSPIPPTNPSIEALASQTYRRFVDRADPAKALVVLCHSDADGLAAGAILTRSLRREGRRAEAVVTGKAGSAWAPETAALLRERAAGAGALIVADLGVRDRPVWPGLPTLFIDHHRPTGRPADAEVLSAYGQTPTPTSGLLAYWCVRPCAAGDAGPGVAGDASEWIAAVSLLSDLGDRAPFALLAEARKRWGATHLRQATSLLNAPRRAATGDATPALELLLQAEHPREIADESNPASRALREAKAEVDLAFAQAKKAAPKFSGNVALVRMHTPCQVHPMVAQIWRTRLPKQIVIGANGGYRPGHVHFSARCGPGTNLLDFLREHRPPGADPETYGNGHDQAGGGALPYAVWNLFVEGLGFGPETQVDETSGEFR